MITSNRNHLDPDHSDNIEDGERKAIRDIVQSAPFVDGFWGYPYQQNPASIRAGQRIMKELAKKRKKGVQI